jgi:hypothetical protein
MARNDDGDDDEYEYEILPKRPKHLDPAKDSMDLMNTSLDESESDYAPGPSNACEFFSAECLFSCSSLSSPMLIPTSSSALEGHS